MSVLLLPPLPVADVRTCTSSLGDERCPRATIPGTLACFLHHVPTRRFG